MRCMQVLIATLAAVEGWNGLLPWPLVCLIVGRDLGLIIGGFVVRAKTKPSGVPFFDTRQASAMQVSSCHLHARHLTSLLLHADQTQHSQQSEHAAAGEWPTECLNSIPILLL